MYTRSSSREVGPEIRRNRLLGNHASETENQKRNSQKKRPVPFTSHRRRGELSMAEWTWTVGRFKGSALRNQARPRSGKNMDE